eukprot:5097802-Pleurochrysis_carterae.AAC.2
MASTRRLNNAVYDLRVGGLMRLVVVQRRAAVLQLKASAGHKRESRSEERRLATSLARSSWLCAPQTRIGCLGDSLSFLNRWCVVLGVLSRLVPNGTPSVTAID